jgi:hypothetical protein
MYVRVQASALTVREPVTEASASIARVQASVRSVRAPVGVRRITFITRDLASLAMPKAPMSEC